MLLRANSLLVPWILPWNIPRNRQEFIPLHSTEEDLKPTKQEQGVRSMLLRSSKILFVCAETGRQQKQQTLGNPANQLDSQHVSVLLISR